MELITQFINDLGNFIFIPVIFLVLMKLLGRPLSECISSAIKVGIGFIALTMTIKLMLEKMQPAVTGLAEATGSSLSAIDVGAQPRVMGFGQAWARSSFHCACGKYRDAGGTSDRLR
jgi:PTS system IIC component